MRSAGLEPGQIEQIGHDPRHAQKRCRRSSLRSRIPLRDPHPWRPGWSRQQPLSRLPASSVRGRRRPTKSWRIRSACTRSVMSSRWSTITLVLLRRMPAHLHDPARQSLGETLGGGSTPGRLFDDLADRRSVSALRPRQSARRGTRAAAAFTYTGRSDLTATTPIGSEARSSAWNSTRIRRAVLSISRLFDPAPVGKPSACGGAGAGHTIDQMSDGARQASDPGPMAGAPAGPRSLPEPPRPDSCSAWSRDRAVASG